MLIKRKRKIRVCTIVPKHKSKSNKQTNKK